MSDGIKIDIAMGEIILDYPGRPNIGVLQRGRWRWKRETEWWQHGRTQSKAAGFEDERRDYEFRIFCM